MFFLTTVSNLLIWRWPNTAETCRHRRSNKLRYLDSCVLTDLPTIIYIKHNGDNKPKDIYVQLKNSDGGGGGTIYWQRDVSMYNTENW
jgi:hypothetical protein